MSFEFNPTAFQKSMFALALAALPVIALIAMVAGAVLDLSAHHARMTALRRERATYEQLVADQPRYVREISAIKASGAADALFLPAQISAIAAKIQTAIAQAAKSAGASPRQESVSAESQPSSAFTGVSEHVMFTCDVATLTRVLHQLALAKPDLFVEHLSIDDPGQDAPLAGPHLLNVDMVVAGYMRAST
jgi:hypothetical protein